MLETHIESQPVGTDVAAALGAAGIALEHNVSLAGRSYLRTGGMAGLIASPKSVGELSAAVSLLAEAGQPFKVIGNTSNLLFRDEAQYSVLVSTLGLDSIVHDPEAATITAECGVMMPELSRVALWNSATGFEGLEGIPGTIGGGIFMNAGAYGTELKDKLLSAVAVRPDGRIEEVDAAELGLTHRASALRRGEFAGIVAQCTFRAEPGDAQKIFHKMETFHAKRHKYQDFMYPNLGSIFSGSPYRALAARDRKFKLLSALFYLFRYEYKIFHRESPLNRKWLNDLVLERFDFSYEKQPFSDKTLNCLVNRGQGTDEMIRFIRQLEELIDGRAPLENEIVEGF
ncbi:FAD-binding protein [Mangrovicoccus sp. HB161399]|uniref:FAD-binding protein n=1 Tax=Mangrovicoccus sp. HB161399 TaxID=2720392 RepID=UPI001556A109|nr:FAD-binding protein [Mangrovicoccus sp. HB161399]